MSRRLVILRPEPGGSRTRERARAQGWEASCHPLFGIATVRWEAPAADRFEAVLMTSANAARHGGPGLHAFTGLPLYAVGAATAQAAREAGFEEIIEGGADGAAIADRLRKDGRRHVVHLSGATVGGFDESGLSITRIPVYAAEPVEPAGLTEALADEPVVLLHSPRAARRFALWCDAERIDRGGIAIAAISANTLTPAGEGWRTSVAADAPNDGALMRAAERIAR